MFYTHNHVSGILNKHKLKKNKNYTLFSFRFNKEDKLKNAKPCIHCLHTIKKYHNITNVIYSDDDKLVEEKVCNIQKNFNFML